MCVTYMGTSKLTHNTPKVMHNTPKSIPQGTPKNRQAAGDPQVTHSDPGILLKRPQSTKANGGGVLRTTPPAHSFL